MDWTVDTPPASVQCQTEQKSFTQSANLRCDVLWMDAVPVIHLQDRLDVPGLLRVHCTISPFVPRCPSRLPSTSSRLHHAKVRAARYHTTHSIPSHARMQSGEAACKRARACACAYDMNTYLLDCGLDIVSFLAFASPRFAYSFI